MIYFPAELEYSDEDKAALRLSIANYLKGTDIHTLRKFGAECGIKSPTSKNKDVVIDAVLKVILKEVPPQPRSTRGAPVKHAEEVAAQINSLYEGIKGMLYGHFEAKNAAAVNKYAGFNYTVSQGRGERVLKGCYAPEPYGGGSIRANIFAFNPFTDVTVDEQQALMFPFRAGDEIVCVSEVMPDGGRRLKKVLSVNDHPTDRDFKEFVRFENVKPIFPNKIMRLTGGRAEEMVNYLSPIAYGQRVLVLAPYAAELSDLFVNLSSVEKNTFSVLMGRGDDETSYCLEKLPECAVCSVDAAGVAKAFLAVERAKRVAEQGANAVVVINDLNALLFACSAKSGANVTYAGASYSAISEALKLFNGAKALSSGGSLTIIAVMREGAYPSLGVECSQFFSIAECRLFVSEYSEENGSPFFDFSRSFSKQGERALSKEAAERLKKIKSICRAPEDFLPMGNETALETLKRLSQNK